eukprot:5033036-Prymnesium_polylepis.1
MGRCWRSTCPPSCSGWSTPMHGCAGLLCRCWARWMGRHWHSTCPPSCSGWGTPMHGCAGLL